MPRFTNVDGLAGACVFSKRSVCISRILPHIPSLATKQHNSFPVLRGIGSLLIKITTNASPMSAPSSRVSECPLNMVNERSSPNCWNISLVAVDLWIGVCVCIGIQRPTTLRSLRLQIAMSKMLMRRGKRHARTAKRNAPAPNPDIRLTTRSPSITESQKQNWRFLISICLPTDRNLLIIHREFREWVRCH